MVRKGSFFVFGDCEDVMLGAVVVSLLFEERELEGRVFG